MKKFSLSPGELLLVNDPHAGWVRGMQIIPGQLKLTNERIAFIKNATPFLKLLVKSHDEHVLHEIKLSELQKFSLVDFGKTKRLLLETGKSLPLTFVSPKHEIFMGELKRLTGK